MTRSLSAALLLFVLAVPAPCRDASGLKSLDKALRKGVAPLAANLKGKVCVLDFSELADGAYTSEFGQKVAELVSNRLVNRPKRGYAVMERRELIKILRDSIAMVGDDAEAMKNLQRQGGMDALVSGTYSESGGEIAIDLKAVDAKNGVLLASSSVRLKSAEGLDKMRAHRFKGSAPAEAEAPAPAAPAAAAPPAASSPDGARGPADPLELEVGVFYEGGDGKLYPLREGMVLNSKDNYALYLKPRSGSYVYVYQVDAAKKAFRLFPNPQFSKAENPLAGGREQWIPDGKDYLFLDETRGSEEIFVFATRGPSPALEKITEAETDSIQTAIRTMGVAGRRGGEAPARARGTSGAAMDLVTRKLAAQGDFYYKVSFIHK
ncbi:MAG: DUF4384 domain-containing protein [Elusimicrobia bacterium]|nr:DUF4384 domain-containing protein [Elusimicrobiota bacterium]